MRSTARKADRAGLLASCVGPLTGQGIQDDDRDGQRVRDHRRQERLLRELHEARLERQVDRAFGAEDLQLETEKAEQPGQGDDEARDPEPGVHRAVREADDEGDADRDEDREDDRPAPTHGAHRDDRRCEAADRPDREVDLAQQQHQDDTDGDRADGGALQREVDEVARGEEGVVQALEHDPDDDEPDHHRDGAEVPTSQP